MLNINCGFIFGENLSLIVSPELSSVIVSPELSSVIVSPELSSVRDYVITHSVRSMCMYVCVCMWFFAKLITVSTYIDVLSWDLDTMILG